MITAIDHIVLTAQDMDKTIYFYCEILGMTFNGSHRQMAVLTGWLFYLASKRSIFTMRHHLISLMLAALWQAQWISAF